MSQTLNTLLDLKTDSIETEDGLERVRKNMRRGELRDMLSRIRAETDREIMQLRRCLAMIQTWAEFDVKNRGKAVRAALVPEDVIALVSKATGT